jgi:hypothetical protein
MWTQLAPGIYDGRYGMAEFKRASDYDIGVLVLEQPAASVFPGVTPARLAPEGALDRFVTGTRNVYFTQVGYGVQQDFARGKPLGFFIDGRRMRATAPLKQLTPTQLIRLGNYRDKRGEGASCHGDSGSPVLYDRQVVALHTWGTEKCTSTQGGLRMDAAIARSFLSPFVDLP